MFSSAVLPDLLGPMIPLASIGFHWLAWLSHKIKTFVRTPFTHLEDLAIHMSSIGERQSGHQCIPQMRELMAAASSSNHPMVCFSV